MGQVVKLAERRGKRAGGGATRLLEERTYFCMACDTDRFLLYPGGRVQCAHCGAHMENLQVSDSAPPDAR